MFAGQIKVLGDVAQACFRVWLRAVLKVVKNGPKYNNFLYPGFNRNLCYIQGQFYYNKYRKKLQPAPVDHG